MDVLPVYIDDRILVGLQDWILIVGTVGPSGNHFWGWAVLKKHGSVMVRVHRLSSRSKKSSFFCWCIMCVCRGVYMLHVFRSTAQQCRVLLKAW